MSDLELMVEHNGETVSACNYVSMLVEGDDTERLADLVEAVGMVIARLSDELSEHDEDKLEVVNDYLGDWINGKQMRECLR